jgi:hypothetical protein
MTARALGLVALLLALAAAPAAAAPLRIYQVPTGGFSLGVPSSWLNVTAAAPAVLKQLERVPAFRAFALAASQSGALKLIAADPVSGGRAYMDVGVERVGAIPLQAIAAATRNEIVRTVRGRAAVSTTKVTLPAGPAYLIHVAGTPQATANDTYEYLLVHDQVEYVLVYVAPAAVWTAYAGLFSSSAGTFGFVQPPDLSRVVLAGAQVGSGYRVAAFPGGNSFIGEATLDLCAGTYPSETLRTGRLQVTYSHPANTVAVSNEVVTYVPGGARKALAEVTSVARSCASKPVVRSAGGVTTTFRAAPLRDPQLPGAVAVKLVINARMGTRHATQTGVAIYQIRGDTLSGVYTFVAKGTTLADAERVAFHAALESARNLGAARAAPGQGTGKGKGRGHGGGFVA